MPLLSLQPLPFILLPPLLLPLGCRESLVSLFLQLLPRLLESTDQVLIMRLCILECLVGRAQIGIEVTFSCPELLDRLLELVNALTKL